MGDLDFVIAGAQKSASTFLHRCLAEHPQVEMPPGESRHFEDPYFGRGAPRELPDLFGARVDGIRRGIKRPDYLARPPVAGRLASAFPDLRVLVVLREPVARAVSAYFDYVRLGFAPVSGLDDAFTRILDGTMQHRYPRTADVLEYGLYGRHLTRFLEVFPREQLLALLQDDVVADPLRELASAFRFIDVDPGFRPASLDRRPNSGVYAPVRLRLLRSRNRQMFSYAPDLTRREPRTPNVLGQAWVAAATAVDRVVLSAFDHGGAPALDPEVLRRLQDFYADDGALLEELLGRALPTWPGHAPGQTSA